MLIQDALALGRQAYASGRWRPAFEQLTAADAAAPLEPDDLELLATAAYLIGNDADALTAWTRAFHEHLDRDVVDRAARCGFWIAVTSLISDEGARGSGWLARIDRLLEERNADCVERGFVLALHALLIHVAGDPARAEAMNREVLDIATRFGDTDLVVLGLLQRGETLIDLGRSADGIPLLDEAMVTVAAGEVSPILSGIMYCAVILACRKVFDVRRADEWTTALQGWCAAQPDLMPFRGQCLVHRAEILQLRGSWIEALAEAERACRWLSEPPRAAAAEAFYQLGELHRLHGSFDLAEAAYKDASRLGVDPQPGLALLRLAQGRPDAASATIRRVLDEAEDALTRARLLAPAVEILLATVDVEAARVAADELRALAVSLGAPYLDASAAQATGAVLLAEGATRDALEQLRAACAGWQQLDAPYAVARVRVLLGRALEQLGDSDGAALESDAARTMFEQLGAHPDLASLEAGRAAVPGGLTGREIEVLTLIAAGKSNRQIAADLIISERTVARHVSNIFTKLDVTSRAAAAAYGLKHGLI